MIYADIEINQDDYDSEWYHNINDDEEMKEHDSDLYDWLWIIDICV